MKKILLNFLVIVCLVTISNAQQKTGSVSGSVFTTDGQPASNVTVIVENTSIGAITSSDGSFIIKKLNPGNYTLQISLVGFSAVTRPVNIIAGRQHEVNFNLELSAQELNEVIIKSVRNNYKEEYPSSTLRLQTSLLQLPQNIQVITGNTLHDQQILDMSEAVTRNVSGATGAVNDNWGNYSNLSMRGATVTPFRNGMNVKTPWGPLLEDMSMVEQIEFVKGPAGFMFANGEPTGLYNIVTKKPTGITKGHVNFSLGSFDTYRTTLDLDGKLSGDGKMLYRLNLMGQLKNSHREFDFNNRFTIVPVLTYRFNEKTSITAEYTYQHMNMAMLGSSYLFSSEPAELPRNFTLLEPNLEPTNINDHTLFLTFNHQLAAGWKFTTQFAYLNYQQTGSSIWPEYPAGLQPNGDLTRSIANWDAFSESRLGQVFLNGRFSTGSINHNVLGGLDMAYKNYYADFYQTRSITGFDPFGSPVPFNIYSPVHGLIPPDKLPRFDRSLPLRERGGGTLGESSESLYVQDEISIIQDRVRLTIAGRHTRLKQHSFGTFSKDNEFTPRAGINYSLNKSTSVYGLYDKTFVAQQGADSASKPFVPVTGNNIEAGIKKDWMGGRWNSTFSVYRIIRNNVITLVPGPEYNPVQTGQTSTKGIELDVRGEICKSLNLIMNYAFTENEVTKDEDPAKVGEPVPGPGFPKHITNAWISYKVFSGKIKGIGASLGYQYQAERQNDLPDYFRLDGNVFWETGKVRISVNVINIMDKYLYSGAPYEYDNDASTTEFYYQVEPGINFRLGIGYNF